MSDDRDIYDLILALRKAQRKFADRIGGNDYVSVDIIVSAWDANWEHILKVVSDSDYGFPLPADGLTDHPGEMPYKVSAVAEREGLNDKE